VSPLNRVLNLIPLDPPGSGEWVRAALLAGASVMRTVETPVVV
jgi:hypothetical protein